MGKNINFIVSENIKMVRKEKNFTQAVLAEKADVAIDTVARMEAGKPISLDTFCRVAKALEKTPAYLLSEKNDIVNMLERFEAITFGRSKNDIEYILFVIEKMLEGKERYQV